MKRAKAESDATIPEEQPNKLENKRHTKIIVYGRVVDSRSTKQAGVIHLHTKRKCKCYGVPSVLIGKPVCARALKSTDETK